MNWVPKLRRALQNGEREETADMEIRDEAMGLLDIVGTRYFDNDIDMLILATYFRCRS